MVNHEDKGDERVGRTKESFIGSSLFMNDDIGYKRLEWLRLGRTCVSLWPVEQDSMILWVCL